MVIKKFIAFLNDNPAAFAWSNYASFLDVPIFAFLSFSLLYSDQSQVI